MRRFHLFEWEDQVWLPRIFRDFITDHLRYTLNEAARLPVNEAIARRLQGLLSRVKTRRVIDLCAGAGGPLLTIDRILAEDLNCPVDVVVTDLYPNAEAFKHLHTVSGGRITPRYQPTNASNVPQHLTGVRTLFTAMHHFRPDDARAVLNDAVRKKAPIAVFEPLQRSLRFVALVGVMSLLRGFTHTPRVGDLSWRRLLFTYIFPLAPALFAWDGMVSVARTYTPEELLHLARSIGAENYSWESGTFEVFGRYGPTRTIYLIGVPG
jgi:hypothetical protein